MRADRRPVWILSAVLSLTLAVAGCSDNKSEQPPANGGGGGDTMAGADTMTGGDGMAGDASTGGPTWSGEVQAIFAANCTGCHSTQLTGVSRGGAPPSVNFDTYDDATGSADRALVRMSAGTMPPGGPAVPGDDVATVQAWIDAGMPR